MKEDGFDITTTRCGPKGLCALWFALGGPGEPYDEKAVKLALGLPGVDVNATDDGGRSDLFVQCYLGRSRNVRLLLADPRVNPNLADANGYTPLHAASRQGMDRCVAILLSDPRVDPNIATTVNGKTPLHLAAQQGHDRIVELLLADLRVDPNLADAKGATPMYAASGQGMDMYRCVEALLSDPRVDPNIANVDGDTPLNIAAGHGSDGCVELFLGDNRVDVCRANASGQPPLVSACAQLMQSMDQVGAVGDKDPARTLVIMLRSRRIPKHNLKESIAHLFQFMPNRRQIHKTPRSAASPCSPPTRWPAWSSPSSCPN
jgi:ankyrin repeat protein